MQFDFKMEHVPGILNLFPDKISRIYDFDDREDTRPVVLTLGLGLGLEDKMKSAKHQPMKDLLPSFVGRKAEIMNSKELEELYILGHLGF